MVSAADVRLSVGYVSWGRSPQYVFRSSYLFERLTDFMSVRSLWLVLRIATPELTVQRPCANNGACNIDVVSQLYSGLESSRYIQIVPLSTR